MAKSEEYVRRVVLLVSAVDVELLFTVRLRLRFIYSETPLTGITRVLRRRDATPCRSL
jgi:hypothetical protein